MDLGSGLTFGTRTVDGKVTTGIFFGNKSKSSTQRLPIRSTIHPDDDGTMNNENAAVTKESTTKTSRPRNQLPKPKPKLLRTKSATSVGSDASNKSAKKTTVQKTKKTNPGTGAGKVAKKPKEDENISTEEAGVNTKYVTLTQGQLTTILSLVKSQNDLDISSVLDSKEEETDGEVDDTDSGDQDAEQKEEKILEKSDEANKNVTNLLETKKSKAKQEKKSKQNSLKEKNRTGPEENEKSSNDEKPAESSISKSTFYLGETIQRDGASSAKKRENQQRWREELEQQRDEERKRKGNERNERLQQVDEDLWTRHFDTMLPTKGSPRVSDSVTHDVVGEFKSSLSDSNLKKQLHVTQSTSEPVNQITELEKANSLRNSIDNSEIGDFASTFTNTAIPQRSSYLRTMTSLLDPAQIEALEVKRRKQDEHRKAIEAQVAERKQKRAEENERRQQLEAEEDRRLVAERDFFNQRAENEKARHQLQETMREQKTKELYQQMKNAEESALRDKLARREQILRTKGHDTSRLERTHQMTLEMTQKVEQPPLSHRDNNNPLTIPITNLEIPTESHSTDTRTPFSVTAHTEQGPIKLEISLNQRRDGVLVESAVQTDSRLASDRRMIRIDSDSDGDTEYLKLPQKSRISENTKKMQDFEKNRDRHYDKYSRNTTNISKPKRNQPRPKWGVAQKNQTFVPASKRYTIEQQMHDPIMRNREERLQERRDLAKKRQDESERERERKERQNRRDVEKQKREICQQQPKYPSTSINNAVHRPKSPVVPAARTRQKEITRRPHNNLGNGHRPSSGIYATSEKAKYRSDRHTSESPVPQANDFVEYRRTTAVLDPSIPQSRPETGAITSNSEFIQDRKPTDGDPLLNPDMVRQHERQERILREISILRQGLLLKQREVAGYPAAMTQNFQPLVGASSGANLILAGGGNLPERTNDTP